MPRAFLIKAKKEKKKEDGAPSPQVQVNRQFSNGISGEFITFEAAKISWANFLRNFLLYFEITLLR